MTSTEASAQRSGSLQATAQVVDTRESWTDLKSARSMAASWQITSAAISQTNLAQVSMVVLPAWSPAEESPKAEITINYIRN
ncbi:MAG: hypothetical protein ABI613_02420 [Gemmatimonadota bacterium]